RKSWCRTSRRSPMRSPRPSLRVPRAPTSSASRFPRPWDPASRSSRGRCSVSKAANHRDPIGAELGSRFRPLRSRTRSMPEPVLIYSRFPKSLMVRIGERFELMDAAGKPPDQMFAPEQLAGIRAMISAGGTPLGGEIMDLMPKLGAIVCYGSGYDGIDLAAAARRGITIGHSPGANASSVADIAMTLMLAVTRRLLVADDYVRSGNWAAAKPSPMLRPQPGMLRRRVGVYGMGEIGRKIAARVAAFESEVGYFSRTRHELPYRYFPTLAALAEWCSVLMIAVRAGPDTHHAVDGEILKGLGADGYVVNISRGSV